MHLTVLYEHGDCNPVLHMVLLCGVPPVQWGCFLSTSALCGCGAWDPGDGEVLLGHHLNQVCGALWNSVKIHVFSFANISFSSVTFLFTKPELELLIILYPDTEVRYGVVDLFILEPEHLLV